MPRIRSIVALAGRIAALVAVPAVVACAAARAVVPAEVSHRVPARLSGDGSPDRRADTVGSTFRMAVDEHYGRPGNASGYSVILVTGTQQAWAFGGTNPGGPSAPVAAGWNGTTMSPAALPSGLASFISDASATSDSDIWAASQYGRYILHYDGSSWQVARRWPNGQITGLNAISPTDVWAFGTTGAGSSDIGTWHFDGVSWQHVAGLANSVCRASAVSSDDIWAIAASPASYSILQFDGTTWHPVPTGAALAGLQPRDILASSASDVWVLADEVGTSGGVRLVLLHWNGAAWTRLVTPYSAWPGRLAAGPGGSVLITATPAGAAAGGLILQASVVDGRPLVSIRSSLDSGGISDVALADGAGGLWASGAVLNHLGGSAAIWSTPSALAGPAGLSA